MNDMLKTSTNNFDVIYLSYDEPNAADNWADLKTKIPWAKRVHGKKGFDAAHKECAKLSETDNFFTIDGDNRIDPSIFDQEMEYNPDYIYSWGSKNHINGLIYGNGGIKLWPKHVVENMRTHETSNGGIEFCWDLPYFQMNNWYSTSYNNTTAFQAFRVGFREGVKLSLLEGKRAKNLTEEIWHGNLKRLNIWLTIGADVDNGIYSIFGSRLGCYLTNLTDFDISLIADYDWFDEKWKNEWVKTIEDDELFSSEYNRLLEDLRNNLQLPIVNFGKKQSFFFKSTLENPARIGLMHPEKEYEKQLMPNNTEEKNI